MIESSPRTTSATEASVTPDAALDRLWREGLRPDLRAFLAAAGPLELEDLLAVVRVDQRRRWLAGERVAVAAYARDFPAVACDPEAVFELVYHELLIREEVGERPDADEYASAYPDLAGRLRMQLEVHDAFALDEGWDR